MTAKEIVDKHFTKEYAYYKRICSQRYKGRYLKNDLLHDTYLGVLKKKDETIFKAEREGRLKTVFISTMRYIFEDRKQIKLHIDGKTSDLNESCISVINSIDYLLREEGFEKDIIDMETQTHIQELIDTAMATQNNGTKERSDYLKVSVFLHAVNTNISQTSRDMCIPRYFISEIYNEGRMYLKQAIDK